MYVSRGVSIMTNSSTKEQLSSASRGYSKMRVSNLSVGKGQIVELFDPSQTCAGLLEYREVLLAELSDLQEFRYEITTRTENE
jgi:hypothetical protein